MTFNEMRKSVDGASFRGAENWEFVFDISNLRCI